jgi:hypothetical protein
MVNYWASFGGGEYVVEVTIRDPSGSKVDSFKFGSQNYKERIKVFKKIQQKYGIDLFLRANKDLAWLKSNELD